MSRHERFDNEIVFQNFRPSTHMWSRQVDLEFGKFPSFTVDNESLSTKRYDSSLLSEKLVIYPDFSCKVHGLWVVHLNNSGYLGFLYSGPGLL